MIFISLLCAEFPVPFAVNDTTSELVVTAPVDREEKEVYHLLLKCLIQTDTTLDVFNETLHINIYDEDDNPPYVNGTDNEDVLIEFSRSKVSTLQCCFVTILQIENICVLQKILN